MLKLPVENAFKAQSDSNHIETFYLLFHRLIFMIILKVCDCMYDDITTGLTVTWNPSTTKISETPMVSLIETSFDFFW